MARKSEGASASVTYEDGDVQEALQHQVTAEAEPKQVSQPQQQSVPTSNPFLAMVPAELVPLPSKGRVYPEGHSLHNAEFVEIRHMTARDEDILTTRSFIRRGNVIDVLIKNCLVNKKIDVKDLLVGDRNAIMVTLRITGFGPQYVAKVTHPVSNEEFEHTFQLDGLPVKELGANPITAGENLFDLKLPKSNVKILFRLLTGADEDVVNRQIEAQRKHLQGGVDTLVTSRLKQQILRLEDQAGNSTEDRGVISQFVDNMSSFDSEAFRDYVDKIEPDVDMRQEVTCPVTGEVGEVEIPIGIEFFWPRSRD